MASTRQERRRHLFEFEDFEQTPAFIRDSITDLLHLSHKVLGTARVFAPKIAETLEKTGDSRIIDLCSGGGGAMPMVLDELEQNHQMEVRLTLTDLFPNKKAVNLLNSSDRANLEFLSTPVDATNVPGELQGLRTMICSFHHMPQDLAEGILEDAFNKRQGICIFEITRNWWGAAAGMGMLPIATPLAMPFVKPTPRQLLFTYAVPVIPWTFFWDGFASCLRTYSTAELREMTRDLQAPDYRWEYGHLHHKLVPYGLPYLTGHPLQD